MATASKRSGYVDNWQTGKTVTECNLHMLTTEDCSDVTFRVGSEKHVVRAHRYILVSRSCVFQAMFCGPLAEKGEVTIPDIVPEVFREFLRYIYTDSTNITAENVTGLLYTSRKYAVDALFDQCAAFLEKSLTAENVCHILEQCHGYGELDLEQKALKVLKRAGEKVIKSSGFSDLCSSCLEIFLKSEQLRLKEEDVFEATLSWTRHQCKNRNVPVNNENIQNILGDMRYEIGFASMSLDYLVNVVGQTGMLTDSERVRIMDKFIRQSVDISPFKSTKRKITNALSQKGPLPLQYVSRFRDGVGKCMSVTPGQNAVSISVSKDIDLVGFRLYGPYEGSEQHCYIKAKFMDVDDNVLTEVLNPSIVVQGNKRQNDILFSRTCILHADSPYTLCVLVSELTSECGRDGQTTVEEGGVTFTFNKSPYNKTVTNVSVGQLPGLIFRKLQ